MKLLKRNFLWVIFILIVFLAIATKKDSFIFISEGPYSFGKYIIWLLFFSFLGYSVYCSSKENFFKSLKRISAMLWGRQIGIDLYIGLLIPMLIIYLHAGTLILLVWIIPVLMYANLATLLYLALNYDSIVAHLLI